MSSEPRAEFSRLVPLGRLGDAFQQRIAATEAERAALAARFGLLSLPLLEADVELRREALGTILLSATLRADFVQSCIVTLAPVPGSVTEGFQLRYGPPEAEADAPDGDDDPAFEPLSGGSIDIGEAVAQEFALALPPFPRAPDAAVDAAPPEAPEDGPFAVLRRLRPGEPR